MKIVFRTDASADIGSGHVMRCLTMAQALAAQGHATTFLSSDETPETVPALVKSGFDIKPSEATPECDWLIVDHYGLDAGYESAARDWAKKIAVIDDLADRPHECDLLIDTTYGRSPEDYKSLVPEKNCHLLCGSEYALLRPQFAQARPASLARSDGSLNRILIFFSSTDPHDLTGRSLEALEGLDQALSLDVIIGAHHPDKTGLKARAKNSKHSVSFHENVSDMAALMAAADLAIGAGGTTSWERCALGLPAIIIEIVDNQRFLAKKLAEAGVVMNLGWHESVEVQDIEKAVQSFSDTPQTLKDMSAQAAAICDGRGADRVTCAILAGKVTGHSKAWLRLLEPGDEDLLFKWQKSKDTRRYFRNSSVPSRDEHAAWFKAFLDHPDKTGFIVMAPAGPAGFLRAEQSAETGKYEVSILIASEFQRQGLAGRALECLHAMMPQTIFTAEIHPQNKASLYLFGKHGYKETDQERWFERGL